VIGEAITIPTTVYVEGYSTGAASLEMGFRLQGGTIMCMDIVQFTVIRASITSPLAMTRALIRKRTDTGDTYPSLAQAEGTRTDLGADCEAARVVITASLGSHLAGVPIYFRSSDPDDLSSYETDANGNDNFGGDKGRMFRAPGYNGTDNSGDTAMVNTDVNGVAKAELKITGVAAGNNYVVYVRALEAPDPESSVEPVCSGTIVAWKRIYLEQDSMYRISSDITVNTTPDGDSSPDNVTVANSSLFALGSTVKIFDADNPAGETGEVSAINPDTHVLTIPDLTHSYTKGYPGRGALSRFCLPELTVQIPAHCLMRLGQVRTDQMVVRLSSLRI